MLETGLGGRLDATNALLPVVSVLTPIGYDHEKWLGHTLEEIAGEKAGIIKPGCPGCIGGAGNRRGKRDSRAGVGMRGAARICERTLRASPAGPGWSAPKQNAALAVAACEPAESASRRSGRSRSRNGSMAARFQRWDERTIIDGAHNPAGAQVLAENWREQFGDDRATIILSILGDKDIPGIWQRLAPISDSVIHQKLGANVLRIPTPSRKFS